MVGLIKEHTEEHKNLLKNEEVKQEPKLKENVTKTGPWNQKTKKPFTIAGFTITRILAYFVIYSIAGFIIETLFGLITKGVLESRKSFLYGPFCGIYGVGAVVMIVGLQRFKKNNYTLFAGGFLIGSIVEYVISWIGEMLFDIKWWDYSNMAFNINGRICIIFSIFWGLLAIYLMSHIHPNIDKLLDKFKPNILKIITITFVIFLFLDCLISSFALKMFFARLVNDYDLELQGMEAYLAECSSAYENPTMKKIVDCFFSNEIMLKAFPNIKVTTKEGEIIWVCDILTEIQPYYVRIFTPRIKEK